MDDEIHFVCYYRIFHDQVINLCLTQWKAENAKKIVQSVQMIHREIPVRLAGRIVELQNLPGGLAQKQPIQDLLATLLQSFQEMIR